MRRSVSEIRRDTFLRETGGRAIPLADLEADARTAGAGLEDADRNGDGIVAGSREMATLFGLLDEVDGRRDGRIAASARGHATPAGPILAAVADLSGARGLGAAADGS